MRTPLQTICSEEKMPAAVYDRPMKSLVSADVQVKIGGPGRKWITAPQIIYSEPGLIWLGSKTVSSLESSRK